jgi:predicted DNA-binding protein
MKRLRVILEDELHRRLKVMCSSEGTDMSEVVRKLIEEHVNKSEKRSKK